MKLSVRQERPQIKEDKTAWAEKCCFPVAVVERRFLSAFVDGCHATFSTLSMSFRFLL